MESSIDLKALWKQQAVPVVDEQALHKKITSLRRRKYKQLIWTNVTLISTSLIVFWVWFYYEPQFISTKLGIVLVVAAMVMLLVFLNKMGPLYKALDSSVDSNHYLDALIQIQQRERFFYARIISIYFVILSLGIGLYLYEYTSRMKPEVAITTYAITLAWMAFNWFYLRPKQIKKNAQKLDTVIQQVQELKSQFKGE